MTRKQLILLKQVIIRRMSWLSFLRMEWQALIFLRLTWKQPDALFQVCLAISVILRKTLVTFGKTRLNVIIFRLTATCQRRLTVRGWKLTVPAWVGPKRCGTNLPIQLGRYSTSIGQMFTLKRQSYEIQVFFGHKEQIQTCYYSC